MTFTDDLKAFAAKVEQRQREIFTGCVDEVHGSITEGSPVTGAPGQPVDTGNLINSWEETFPEQWVGQSATSVRYARAVEEGQQAPYTTEAGTEVTPRPMTLRSGVGGFHSVKMTRAGWGRIVKQVVGEVVR